ncbi:MAG: hypothetical protein WAK93_21480 [Solirubrobacteraceae bacterium]
MSSKPDKQARDVLAAEEFVVPAPDPALHHEAARDVLAAEEFVVPAPDPALGHHGPVQLPDDPTGIVEAHDVLAAEEFAMPAPRRGTPETPREGGAKGRATLLAVGALTLVALARRKRRG